MNTRRTTIAISGALALVMAACGQQAASDDPAASAAGGGGDGACDIEFVDGALQPLADGFPEQPITILVADSAGSADDIWARTMQSAVEDISPVRIEVEDREDFTAFGTWEALADMGTTEEGNDGYINLVHTPPGEVLDLHVQPITEETGLDVGDLNAVIGVEQEPMMIVQRPDAPWGDTWEDMVTYAQENPGELRYISREVGSALDFGMEYYMREFDLEMEKIIGGPQPEIAAILGAGEGDVSIMTPSVILPHWESGRLDVIAVAADTAPEPWADAPPITELGDVVTFAFTRALSVTADVPDCHRDWLYALWSAGLESEEYQESRSQIPGSIAVNLDHDEVMELLQDSYERTEETVRELGLHWDQQ